MEYFFSAVSLLGGLAMFLYGMRLMSGTLKGSASGTLKVIMEKVTNNPVKAFFLGVFITAIIQSSTATIVITSGLVAAGILTLDQSLGIIIGSNVGTTVTGQIIRLLDVDAGGSVWLRIFQPSTLAPLSLIIGIVLIMFFKFQKSETIGNIAIGFGILFSGLLNMTASVNIFNENGMLSSLFEGLGNAPVAGYLTGASVAFVLQSSSATIGILQAFSLSGSIPFKAIYIVLCGIYLGDCVTTGIVCSVGAKSDAKRVGVVNILFNLSETILVLIVVNIVHKLGLIDGLWESAMTSGGIANTNSIFNLGCSVALLPMVKVYGKLSRKIVKDEAGVQLKSAGKYRELVQALNPVFFATPALAFRGCYNVLNTMLISSAENLDKAIGLFKNYDEKTVKEIEAEEDNIDMLADDVSIYMLQLSPYIKEENHMMILDQYYKLVTQYERLGDHAVNISEIATSLHNEGMSFSDEGRQELDAVYELLQSIIAYTEQAFAKRDAQAAKHIEPLEQVMDDLVNTLHDNHLTRLREGRCSIQAGMCFLDILSNFERISDICSNVGISTIARVYPQMANLAHSYITSLHQGTDEQFNSEYIETHDKYFERLEEITGRSEDDIDGITE